MPSLMAIAIMMSPILDAMTALTISAGVPITIGVIVRTIFMLFAFGYVVFISDFPGKKVCMLFLAAVCTYLLGFYAHLFTVGGLSLCLHNIPETAKTFFTPFVAVFLYAVYCELGKAPTARSIAHACAIYTGIILLAYLTKTSYISYGTSGYGYCGWFFAANEIGCIVAITGPIAIYHLLTMLPTIRTGRGWFTTGCILFSIVFSANFIGTKVVYLFTLGYCVAGMVWFCVRYCQQPLAENKSRRNIMVMLSLLMIGMYVFSPLSSYLTNIYTEIMKEDSILRTVSVGKEIQEASDGTWLRKVLESNETVNRIDQFLSRRLLSSAPSVQVFADSNLVGQLFGIGYASTSAYGRGIEFMIELDFLAVLVRHGIIGFMVYAVPYLTFIVWAVVQFFRHPVKRLSSFRHCTYLYSTLAGFAIAFIAGHALVSPAVSTFVLVVSMSLWVDAREEIRSARRPVPASVESACTLRVKGDIMDKPTLS